MTITDFDSWLDQTEPAGYEDVYSLFRCVSGEENFGRWECKNNQGKLFIEAGSKTAYDTLMIASPQAKELFLRILRDRYVTDKDLDIEGWYEFRRAMEKDD